MMRIISRTTGFMGSHIYFVIDDTEAVIIDPSDPEIVEQVVNDEGIAIKYLFLTHEHCDHTYGCETVRSRYSCPIFASEICDKNLQDERRNQSRYYEAFSTVQVRLSVDDPKPIKPFKAEADITFHDDVRVMWSDHVFYLRETPGHSEGSSCILLDNKYLFSGDSLMWDELVNTRFPGGSKNLYECDTLPWLHSLNPDIHVFPGHLEEFRLGDRLEFPVL